MDRVELAQAIIELQREYQSRRSAAHPGSWMGLNLTIPQVKSLFFIVNQGTTNFTKLASALGVTPSNVTAIVDRLVEMGLVSRRQNRNDRRMLMLRVTDKGESIIANLRERRTSHTSEILAGLSEEELEAVHRGLGLLLRAAREHGDKESETTVPEAQAGKQGGVELGFSGNSG